MPARSTDPITVPAARSIDVSRSDDAAMTCAPLLATER